MLRRRLKKATAKRTRWQFRLMENDFDIAHWADIKHSAAVFLLWLGSDGTEDLDIDDDNPVMQSTHANKNNLEMSLTLPQIRL